MRKHSKAPGVTSGRNSRNVRSSAFRKRIPATRKLLTRQNATSWSSKSSVWRKQQSSIRNRQS